MSKPARNATGMNAPGQITNPVGQTSEALQALWKKKETPKESPKTFEEWFFIKYGSPELSHAKMDRYRDMQVAWNAAKENK